jgi:hypothetical protein
MTVSSGSGILSAALRDALRCVVAKRASGREGCVVNNAIGDLVADSGVEALRGERDVEPGVLRSVAVHGADDACASRFRSVRDFA